MFTASLTYIHVSHNSDLFPIHSELAFEVQPQPEQASAGQEQVQEPGPARIDSHELEVERVEVDDEEGQAVAAQQSDTPPCSRKKAGTCHHGPKEAVENALALYIRPTDTVLLIVTVK